MSMKNFLIFLFVCALKFAQSTGFKAFFCGECSMNHNGNGPKKTFCPCENLVKRDLGTFNKGRTSNQKFLFNLPFLPRCLTGWKTFWEICHLGFALFKIRKRKRENQKKLCFDLPCHGFRISLWTRISFFSILSMTKTPIR